VLDTVGDEDDGLWGKDREEMPSQFGVRRARRDRSEGSKRGLTFPLRSPAGPKSDAKTENERKDSV
jgi:hypothetical protein